MKLLNSFDKRGRATMLTREVSDDYQLSDAEKANWTDVVWVNPVNGGWMYFDSDKQAWSEQQEPANPTADQQKMAQVLLTMANNKTAQDKINAQLLLATANSQLGGA
ncbi:hypothetical protein [Loigolactobacillus backii]|uniref:hypothetical protein n=1 Tax=Loigolactobacillus backii TaxID=375175 RepID=UPI0022FD9EC4|nr:hypothetical protein [Loigolactobacillus backii]MDA5386538.1 hypothetical protein [Loigolactobacillus backii]MDA5389065.1 hypothetical protein [Loigolactobacillus backii]